jgi:hypothetical protein
VNSAGVLEVPEGDSLSATVVAAPSVGVVPETAASVLVASTPRVAVPPSVGVFTETAALVPVASASPFAASVLVTPTPPVAVALRALLPERTSEAAGASEPFGAALDMVSSLVQNRNFGKKDALTVCWPWMLMVQIQSQKLQGPAMGRLASELAELEFSLGSRVLRRW